jgi:polyhydroxyalkanoate synthase
VPGYGGFSEAGKYQYRANEENVGTPDKFIAGATETKGSWWPDWMRGIGARGAKGARAQGQGKLNAIEDAHLSYVRGR